MNKKLWIGLLLTVVAGVSFGQMTRPAATDDEQRGFKKENLVFGGNLGLTFGDFTFVNLSPQVGYRFADWITAGAGVNYVHTSIRTRAFGSGDELFRENYSYAGANIFGRLFPADFLFVSLQPEANYSWGKIKYRDGRGTVSIDGRWIPSFVVGAGMVLGGNGQRGRGTLISLQYDLAQDPRSPYGTRPFVNVGFAF